LRQTASRGAADSGAVSADPDLQTVIAAWHSLSADVKAAVLALVQKGS
jgi:hypothetical protein